MKIKFILSCLLPLTSLIHAQTRVRENDVVEYKDQIVEVLGHFYVLQTNGRDLAVVKIGCNESSAKLTAYFKFKNASSLATLCNREFGHFTGKVVMVNNTAVLIIDKLNNVVCYAPRDERVDSAVYYQKRGEL